MAEELFKNSDRRIDTRIGAKLAVRFQVARDAARALNAYSINFSAGGLCLRTKTSHQLGDRLELELTIEGEAFELSASVSWIRGDAIGVRFEDVSPRDRERLEWVAKLLAKTNPLVP